MPVRQCVRQPAGQSRESPYGPVEAGHLVGPTREGVHVAARPRDVSQRGCHAESRPTKGLRATRRCDT
jgi:hypothetical protein